MKRRPVGPTTLIVLAAVASLAAAGLPATGSADEDAGPAPSALTQVAPLQRGTIATTVVLYGSAQAGARARQTIMAPASAQVSSVSVRVGERVAAGAALLQLEPTPASAAGFEAARSSLTVAAQALMRTRSLLQQHLATAQQLEDAEKAEADARAMLASLKAQGAGGPLTVQAPFAATVTALTASVGSIVSQGGALVELVRPQGLVLQAAAVPQTASAIQIGAAASITAVGTVHAVQGKVLLRGEAVDPTSGLVPIEMSIPGASMLPGQQAIATVTTGTVEAYLVPHEAILLNDEGNPYVVQVVNGVAKKVEVQVLGMQDGRDGIAGALTANAPIALSGNYQLEDGMKVRTAADTGRATR
jgi:RND family efflux transporter MFP subunit